MSVTPNLTPTTVLNPKYKTSPENACGISFDTINKLICDALGIPVVAYESWEESCCDPTMGYRYHGFKLSNGKNLPRFTHHADLVYNTVYKSLKDKITIFNEHLSTARKNNHYYHSGFTEDFQHCEALMRTLNIGTWEPIEVPDYNG